jgi:hypothetical protein
MVSRKTFCVRDFFTTSLRVAWISETCYKSLSINDLHRQGTPPRKPLTINDLRILILEQNLNETKKSETFLKKSVDENKNYDTLLIWTKTTYPT